MDLLTFLAGVIIFILGAIVGSFLNVVALRWGTGHSFATGRSKCFSCAKGLSWYELVPVFSFLGLRGRCRGCKSLLSWQYVLVELLTGIIFVLAFFTPQVQASLFIMGGVGLLVLLWTISSVLIVLTIYDLRHMIIPDGLVFSFIALSLIVSILEPFLVGSESWAMDVGVALATGFGLALFFFIIWWASRGKAMGFGDVKLAFGIGLLLPGWLGVNAMIIAFWSGALVGLALLVHSKWSLRGRRASTINMKSAIPFAPFLVFGALLVLLCNVNVIPIF